MKETTLWETQDVFRNIVEMSPNGIGVLDKLGNIVWVNQAFLALTGFEEDEIVDKHFSQIPTKPKIPNSTITQIFKQLLKGKNIGVLEFTWQHKNGERRAGEAKTSILKNEGKVIGVQVILNDITDRKATEKALRESEERFMVAGLSTYDLIYEWEVASDKLEWFGDIDGFLGYKPGEISRDISAWLALIHPDDLSQLEDAVEHHRTSTSPIEYNYRIKHKNGTFKHWSDKAQPILDDKERPEKWIGVCKDITIQVLADEKVRQLSKFNEDIVMGVAEALLMEDGYGKITFTNPAMQTMLGYTREGLLNLQWREIVPEAEIETINQKMAERFMGETQQYETVLLAADGLEVPVIANVRHLYEGDKKIGTLSAFTDITERIQAEEKFRVIFESAPDACYLHDLHGTFTDGNQAAEVMTGYKKEELFGKSFLKLNILPKNQIPKAAALLAKHALGIPTGPDEFNLKQRDGGEIVVEISSHPVKIRNQSLVLGIARDISYRKEAEATLRKERDKARLYLDIAGIIIVALNKNGEVTLINRKGCQILGYGQDEIIGENWFDLIIPEKELAEAKTVFNSLMTNQIEPNEYYENHIITKSGEERIIAWHNTNLRDELGNISGKLSSGEDITERKFAEERVEYQALLLENISDAVISMDSEFNIISLNKAAVRTYGWQEDEVRGRNFGDVVNHKYLDSERAEVLTRFSEKGSWQGEVSQQKKNGEWISIFSSLTNQVDPDGNTTGVIAVNRDITGKKQAEKVKAASYNISQAALSTEDLDELYLAIHNILSDVIPVENFCIGLYNSSKDLLSFPYFVDQKDSMPPTERLGHGLSAYVLRTGKPLLATPEVFSELIQQGEIELVGTKPVDWLGVPLRIDNRIIGIVIIQSYTETLRFDQNEIDLLEFVSAQIAQAIERIRSQHQIWESEMKYRTLFENVPSGVYRSTPSGRFLMVNPALINILGFDSEEDLIRVSIPELYVDTMEREKFVGKVNKTGRVRDLEIRLKRKDGKVIYCHDNAIAIHSEDGKFVYYEGTIIDISDRKRMNLELRRKTQTITMLFETGKQLGRTLDLDNIYQKIHETIIDVMPCDLLMITSIDLANENIHCDSLWFQKRTLDVDEIPLFSFEYEGKGAFSQVIRTGQAIYIPEITTNRNTQYDRIYINEEGIQIRNSGDEGPNLKSTLIVPFLQNNQVIGVMQVSSHNKDDYSDDNLRFLEALTPQVGIVITNANLHDQTELRAKELSTLLETATITSSTLDLDEVLNLIAEQLVKALDVEGCSLSRWDPKTNTIVTWVDHRESESKWQDKPGTIYQLEDYPATRNVLMNCQHLAITVSQPDADQNELEMMNRTDVLSLLMIPLVVGDRAIGLIELDDGRYEREFKPEEIQLVQAMANQAAIAIENARLFKEANRRLENIQALRKIDQAIVSSFDINIILNILLDQVISRLEMDAANILLLEPHMNTLTYSIGRGFRFSPHESSNLRIGEGPAGIAALERRMIHIPEIFKEQTRHLSSPRLKLENFISYFAVPLISKGVVKGVLEIYHRSKLEPDQEWFDFLQTLAGQAAITIDNIDLFNDMQRANSELTMAYDSTLEGWAKALELRDMETEGHSRRVVDLTLDIARMVGCSHEELIHIRRGALLHDIGKMGIPDSILAKPGPLNDDEWEIMRRHPQIAYDWLTPIRYLRPAIDIPFSHHEKWDGSGYPQGLKGEEIPLAARIFAIVDVWEALTSDRPYRKSWTQEKIVEHFKEQKEKHFDPKIVEAFLSLVSK